MLHTGLEPSNVGSVHPGSISREVSDFSCRVKGGCDQYRTGNFSNEPLKSCPSLLSLLLTFRLPVVKKLFQARIGERMFKQRLEDAIGHGADVSAG